MGIQTREAFDNGMKISMGFESQIEEQTLFTISIDAFEGQNLDGTSVYLVDNELSIITDLTEQDYNFVSGKGNFKQRFTIQFEYEVLGTPGNSLETIAIYPNPTRDLLNIVSPLEVIETVQVLDIHGRTIQNIKLNASGIHQLDMSNAQTAVYFVKIQTENGSITKRIVKE